MHGSIETKGVPETVYALHELGVRAGDVRRVSSTVERVFHESERRIFDRAGPGWPPLAASTRQRKQREGLSPELLRATDALYESLTGGAGGTELVTRDSFRFGTSVPYARFHEGGEGVPRRSLTDLTPNDRKQVTQALERFIVDGTVRW